MKIKREDSVAVLLLKTAGWLVLSVVVLPLALVEHAVLTWCNK